jgi:hypothetical protein
MNMKTLRLWPLAAVLLTGVASAEESICQVDGEQELQ